MRKIVNLLQSVSLEHIKSGDSKTISASEIYNFTSHPNPDIVSNILNLMLTETFHKAY